MSRSFAFRRVSVGALAATVCVLACGEGETGLVDPLAPQFAKGGAGTIVDSADPPYGKRGEVGKSVAILGSGFQPGDQASWQLDGVPDPRINVVGTQYVSSTQLIATIDIALDAELRYYDIAVSGPGRKGGIGTERFEVTSANLLPQLTGRNGESGTSVAWGINDAGHIVGRSATQAFFWSMTGGIEDLGMGTAFDVDDSGTTVVGADRAFGSAMLWVKNSDAWTGSTLPTSCVNGTVTDGLALAVSSDGSTAVGHVGVDVPRRSKSTSRFPLVWNLVTGGCTVLPLVPPHVGGGRVTDIGADVAVGWADSRPMAWIAGVPSILALLPGTTDAQARAVNDIGTLAVGISGGRAVVWTRSGSTWSAPAELVSGPCQGGAISWGDDVNNGGLVGGRGCDGRAWYWQFTSGVATAAGPLPGFGQKESGNVEGINNVTTAGLPSMAGGAGPVAVYWLHP